MNKFTAKLAQAGFMTLFGYEIGEKVSGNHENIIVKVQQPETHNLPNEKTYKDFALPLVLILFVLLIIIVWFFISKSYKKLNRKLRRNEMIELNDRRAPRV